MTDVNTLKERIARERLRVEQALNHHDDWLEMEQHVIAVLAEHSMVCDVTFDFEAEHPSLHIYIGSSQAEAGPEALEAAVAIADKIGAMAVKSESTAPIYTAVYQGFTLSFEDYYYKAVVQDRD